MNHKSYNIPIGIISVVIPIVVLVLFYLKPPDLKPGFDLRILPALHAALNFTTFITLLAGYYFIRTSNRKAHQYSMTTALGLSIIFLLSYVTYHSLTEPTRFGGEGVLKGIYYFLLVSHIVLATIIVPLVLFTFARGLQAKFVLHKKIARWTLPIWLYVSFTGVMVYLLISPYYV